MIASIVGAGVTIISVLATYITVNKKNTKDHALELKNHELALFNLWKTELLETKQDIELFKNEIKEKNEEIKLQNEEIFQLQKRMATESEKLTEKVRIQSEYLTKLRKHIIDGKQPPPPEIPKELKDQ